MLAPPWLFAREAGDQASVAGFHLHPHYRSPLPLDDLFLKTKAGSDAFITEKYAQEIEEIFAKWSFALRQSSADVNSISEILAADFSGASLRPSQARLIRSGIVEVRQNEFAQQDVINGDALLQELRGIVASFSKILTAEFQVTRINNESATDRAQIRSRLRYEIVGTASDSYREQLVGYWDLTWQRSVSGNLRLLEWHPLEETRSRSAAPVYVDLADQAFAGNTSYSAQLSHGTDYWRTVLDGACGIDIYGHNGVSVGDIDNDGFDDLYICEPAGLPNRLFRNRGDGTFEDITELSGVGVLENTACALFIDVNNDGRQDLVVVRANGPLLFLNEGNGKFRQKPDAFQFATPPQGTFTGAAAADYDSDGWLDIYFCLYVYYQGTEQYKYPSPYFDAENGPPNFMMRNNRDGTFRDVTRETGLDKNNTRYSFCCGWSDFNNDGWPDLYVVNDFGRKNLYRNNGNGTFTDVAAEAAVEDVGAGMGVCWFDYDNDGAQDLYIADMWTAAGDRITTQEIFKKDSPPHIRALYQKHAMGNSLFRNGSPQSAPVTPVLKGSLSVRENAEDHRENPQSFQNRTDAAGVGLGRWAWSCDAWDFDHDGFSDLYIANGMISGPRQPATTGAIANPGEDLNSFFWRQVVAYSPDQARPSHDYEQGWNAINELIRADRTWSGYERNVFYANNGNGTFSEISGVIGLDFLEDGRAFALADFDHDGRQELILKNRNHPQLRLLKNMVEKLPPSISFRLRGTKSNRDAIGASITIEIEASSESTNKQAQTPASNHRQTRFLQAGSGFLSQHSKEVFFGLGDVQGTIKATIRWPSGLVQELHNLPVNHRISVDEGSPAPRVEAFKSSPSSHQPPQENPATYVADSLPTAVETWLLAPISAPDFSLPDLDGRTQSLSSFRGKTVLLNFWIAGSPDCQSDLQLFREKRSAWARQGCHLLTVNFDSNPDTWRASADRNFPILRGSDDLAGVYTIVYRYLFDRHRDLSLPTSFLINDQQEIVKIYQGALNSEHVEHDFAHIPKTAAERLARALPFPGVTEATDFGRNHLSYGSVFFQRGYLDEAKSAFEEAARDDTSSAEAVYGLGSVYLNKEEMGKARAYFERAIKLTASYPDTLPNAWNNLGLISAREGHPEQALPFFKEALRLSPDHSIALVNLGSAYRQLTRWDDSRQTLERALAIHPEDPEANYGLGMVFAQTDDTDHAYEYLQRALRSRPNYPEALNNLGILYLRTHRPGQAVATFEDCIRVAPAFNQAYLNLARVYTIEEQPEKARAILLELLKQRPDDAQAREMLDKMQ